MNHQTGILFFTRTPEGEAKAKQWTKSKKQNLFLARQLYKRNISIAKKSSLNVVVFDDNIQHGETFNEKIVNALVSFFQMGYENAIVIGSDCVNLSLGDIQQAHLNLKNKVNTVGETTDGGIYLFAIAKNQLCVNELKSLKWCTPNLKEEFLTFLRQVSKREVAFLNIRVDLDYNFYKIQSYFSFKNELLVLIQSIRSYAFNNWIKKSFQDHINLLQNLHFRGPPNCMISI